MDQSLPHATLVIKALNSKTHLFFFFHDVIHEVFFTNNSIRLGKYGVLLFKEARCRLKGTSSSTMLTKCLVTFCLKLSLQMHNVCKFFFFLIFTLLLLCFFLFKIWCAVHSNTCLSINLVLYPCILWLQPPHFIRFKMYIKIFCIFSSSKQE